MDAVATQRLRSFNRSVTQRIGVLEESFLARGRPYGASRVLWEIGDGTDLRTLRARLNLDSGYLSRLIASLQREGLIETAPGADKRVRDVTLSDAGRAELEVLNSKSDQLARDLLAPLGDKQRATLVEAMATVERLLTAGLVAITVEDPRSPDARYCLTEYYAELAERFPGGFDVSTSIPTDEFTFIVARLRGEPVGCGAIRLSDSYIKRMWVAPAARGLGLGRRIVRELESLSTTGMARLETHNSLPEAINLYQSMGYVEVEPFNDEPYAHHWFEKQLS